MFTGYFQPRLQTCELSVNLSGATWALGWGGPVSAASRTEVGLRTGYVALHRTAGGEARAGLRPSPGQCSGAGAAVKPAAGTPRCASAHPGAPVLPKHDKANPARLRCRRGPLLCRRVRAAGARSSQHEGEKRGRPRPQEPSATGPCPSRPLYARTGRHSVDAYLPAPSPVSVSPPKPRRPAWRRAGQGRARGPATCQAPTGPGRGLPGGRGTAAGIPGRK